MYSHEVDYFCSKAQAEPVPAHVYEDALHVLQRRGWCQGIGEDEFGRICLANALGAATQFYCIQRGHWNIFDFSALYDVVGSANIPGRNDDPSTTYEDVVLWLKRAAEIARDGAQKQGAQQ